MFISVFALANCKADSTTLNTIAFMNPLDGGDAVYSARVLLQLQIDDETGTPFRMMNEESDLEDETIVVYPNPNDGNMTIEYEIEGDAEMQITDVMGKVICTYTLFATNNIIEINCNDLSNGVYFYSIIANGNIIKSDKIVIIK